MGIEKMNIPITIQDLLKVNISITEIEFIRITRFSSQKDILKVWGTSSTPLTIPTSTEIIWPDETGEMPYFNRGSMKYHIGMSGYNKDMFVQKIKSINDYLKWVLKYANTP